MTDKPIQNEIWAFNVNGQGWTNTKGHADWSHKKTKYIRADSPDHIIIKKSDVDGDACNSLSAVTCLTAYRHYLPDEDKKLFLEHLETLRNALIAQSDTDIVRAWQPIETIPEGVVVQIAWEMFEKGVVTGKIEDGGIYTDKIECELKCLKCLPTHWMPLPNPPKEKNDE